MQCNGELGWMYASIISLYIGKPAFITAHLRNIIQIHNGVLWDWQYSTKYVWIFSTFKMFKIISIHRVNILASFFLVFFIGLTLDGKLLYSNHLLQVMVRKWIHKSIILVGNWRLSLWVLGNGQYKNPRLTTKLINVCILLSHLATDCKS